MTDKIKELIDKQAKEYADYVTKSTSLGQHVCATNDFKAGASDGAVQKAIKLEERINILNSLIKGKPDQIAFWASEFLQKAKDDLEGVLK